MKKIAIVNIILLLLTAFSTFSTGRHQVSLYSDIELNNMGSAFLGQMKKR